MPHRNRVDPGGALIETAARGAWMGNRGCLHDAAGRITARKPPTDRWIVCRLEFKGRRRALLQPGRYTELFFLDEATGLAAGHRPCFECRREDALRFAAAWPARSRRSTRATATEMDTVLARERAAPDVTARDLSAKAVRDAADGVFVAAFGHPASPALLVRAGQLWPWSPFGYGAPVIPSASGRFRLLTPPSTRSAIERGYAPQMHPSIMR